MTHNPLTRQMMEDFFSVGCKPRQQWGIGTEHEKIPFYMDTLQPVPYEGECGIGMLLQRLADADWKPVYEGENIIALLGAGGASVTLEPGGQLELSGAVLPDMHQTHEETRQHLHQVMTVANAMGIGFLTTAFHPLSPRSAIPWMPKARYAVMGQYMPKVGGRGLDMMLRTATVQANLDFSSEADMAKKMRIACCVQPIVTALFAASPFSEGKPSGYLSTRAACWLDTDPRRTGIPACVFEDDFGFASWVDYLLDVPMYFIIRDGQYVDCSGASFRDFMAGHLPALPGQMPTLDDWALHSSTVFPDVRLKQYIEMRGADAGPHEMITALPALWKGLLYDAEAESAVWQIVKTWSHSDVLAMREAVVSQGLHASMAGEPLQHWSSILLGLAEDSLHRQQQYNAAGEDESIYLAPLWQITHNNASLARQWLESYHHAWGERVEPMFTEARHGLSVK